MKFIDENDPENYSINHSALIYLLGPDGKFVAAFEHGTDLETLAAGIMHHLTKPVE
jgi:protein SCO1/2